jgi:hypothetical protein
MRQKVSADRGAEDARKLRDFAFVCLAIVSARACFAFFQEAILHSLQERLLSRNERRQPRHARFNHRVVAKRGDIATAPLKTDIAQISCRIPETSERFSRCTGLKIGNHR